MPGRVKILTLLMLVGMSFCAFSQDVKVPSASIVPEFVEIPVNREITIIGNSNAKWLRVIVKFKLNKNVSGGDVWADGVSAEIGMLLPGRATFGREIFMTFKETLAGVDSEKKEHYLLFAVMPSTLKRYTTINKFNKASALAIPMMVTFRDAAGQIIGGGFNAPKGMSDKAVAMKFQAASQAVPAPGIFKLDNAVLPKEKTPWFGMEMDLFEISKNFVEGTK